MRKKVILLFSTFAIVLTSGAANYYWVGGTGNWTDFANHWATSSGGSVFHIQVPGPADDVFFDANSFTAAGQTVTIVPNTFATCHNVSWAGVTNNPRFELFGVNSFFQISGSLLFVSGMSTNFNIGFVSLVSSQPETITTAGKHLSSILVNGTGSWTLQDTLDCKSISLISGTLNTNNNVVKAESLFQGSPGPVTLNMGNSVFKISTSWTVSSTLTLNAGNSLIEFGSPNINSFSYFRGGNRTYYNFSGINVLGPISFEDVSTFTGTVSFDGDAHFVNNNTFVHLNFSPGHTYIFFSNKIQTINGTLNATGTVSSPIRIRSSNPGIAATISKPSGSVCLDYVRISDISATGGAFFNAGLSPTRSEDLGGNTGWVFTGNNTTFYRDADGDGFGNAGVITLACVPPPGYVVNSMDCDDNNSSVYPGANEICNGIDDDCDGLIDEGVQGTFYRDADGDGYGNASVSTQACSAPSGYVSNNTDCNDNNSSVYPGATEVCNGIDDDCDGLIDEDLTISVSAGADAVLYYGYAPTQCLTRTATVSVSPSLCTFSWTLNRSLLPGETMTGANTQTVTVCLKADAELCVTATLTGGCSAADCATIHAQDIGCSTDGSNNKVNLCHQGNTICVSTSSVPSHLAHGDYLGSCIATRQQLITSTEKALPALSIYPNPSNGNFTLSFNTPEINEAGTCTVQILNANGIVIKQIEIRGQNKTDVKLKDAGIYFVKLISGNISVTKKITIVH